MSTPEGLTPERLEELRRIAAGYVDAYAKMCDIGEGIGGLAIRDRAAADVMLEFDQTFTDGGSTVLALIDALGEAEEASRVWMDNALAEQARAEKAERTIAHLRALADPDTGYLRSGYLGMVRADDILAVLDGSAEMDGE